MLKRKLTAEEFANLPEHLQGEYKQVGDSYIVDIEGGFKTDEDVAKLNESLRKERDDHKSTRTKYSRFAELDLDEVQTRLDKYDELEQIASSNKFDEAKLNELTEARIKTRVAPLERDIGKRSERIAELEGLVGQYQQRETQRKIGDAVTAAATKGKILPTALEDAMFAAERMFAIDENGNVVTRDGVGVTPGISPEVWMQEMAQRRPHWFPASSGGGATGSGSGGGIGANPWKAETYNLTAQAKISRENPNLASQMKKAAGLG